MPPDDDVLIAAFRNLVSLESAPLRWLGTYEYVVLSTDGETVDARPVREDAGLPPIQGAPLRADSIARQTPKLDGRCHILFLDGDLSRPVCVWTEPADTTGDGASARLVGGGQPVARQGDFVSSNVSTGFVLAGVIAGASPGVITSGAPVTITATLPSPVPISGTVITGRNEVKA